MGRVAGVWWAVAVEVLTLPWRGWVAGYVWDEIADFAAFFAPNSPPLILLYSTKTRPICPVIEAMADGSGWLCTGVMGE